MNFEIIRLNLNSSSCDNTRIWVEPNCLKAINNSNINRIVKEEGVPISI